MIQIHELLPKEELLSHPQPHPQPEFPPKNPLPHPPQHERRRIIQIQLLLFPPNKLEPHPQPHPHLLSFSHPQLLAVKSLI